MHDLIERLAERARDPKRAADEGAGAPNPPLTEEEHAAVEARLGSPLPALLRALVTQVGNGGFGPGHGLIPLDAKSPSLPKGLLRLCDWGHKIESLLDCSLPDAPVIRVDRNMKRADVTKRVPAALHYARAAEIDAACWVESLSLQPWLEAWADGQPLFYLAYAAPDAEDEDEDGDEDEDDEDDVE